PTASVSPSAPPRATTVPAYGDGTSTSAFAVSTVHSGWLSATRSPAATCQATMVASSSPSPRSGTRKVCTPSGTVVPQGALDGVEDAVDTRQPRGLEPRRRVGRVESRGPQHRCLQVPEQLLLD